MKGITYKKYKRVMKQLDEEAEKRRQEEVCNYIIKTEVYKVESNRHNLTKEDRPELVCQRCITGFMLKCAINKIEILKMEFHIHLQQILTVISQWLKC